MLVRTASVLVRLLLAAWASLASATDAEQNIILAKSGGFAVGGRVVTNETGNTLSCDHGYLEYFIPATQRKTSLVMWHSSSTQVRLASIRVTGPARPLLLDCFFAHGASNKFSKTAGTAAKATKICFYGAITRSTCGMGQRSDAPTGVAMLILTLLNFSINSTLRHGISVHRTKHF